MTKRFLFTMVALFALMFSFSSAAMAMVQKTHIKGVGTIILQPEYKQVPLEYKEVSRFEAVDTQNGEAKLFITAIGHKNAQLAMNEKSKIFLTNEFMQRFRKDYPDFTLLSSKLEKYGADKAVFIKGYTMRNGSKQMEEQLFIGRGDVIYGVLITYPGGYGHISDLRTTARSLILNP